MSTYHRLASSLVSSVCAPSLHRAIRPRSAPAAAVLAMSTSADRSSEAASTYRPRYIDIGINLADPIFRGWYHGKQRHPDDLEAVVQRAKDVGCTKLIVTGSSFKSSRDALKLAGQFPHIVYTTAGIHPCSSAIFERRHPHHHEADDEEHVPACGPDPSQPHAEDHEVDEAKSQQIIADLGKLIDEASVDALVAFGEIGLDYDRLHYCSASTQRHSFSAQLALAASLTRPLPLFLHSRACHADFVRLLQAQYGPKLETLQRGAVVHSFTGSVAEAEELMGLGLYLGVNGCSLKTEENCAVVKAIRLDRLMIETDGPWCEVRPSHEGWKYLVAAAEKEKRATPGEETTPEPTTPKPTKKNSKKEPVVPERFKSVKREKWQEGAMVKSRNEPCMIERVATIIAAIKDVPVEEVCEAAWNNTVRVFGLDS